MKKLLATACVAAAMTAAPASAGEGRAEVRGGLAFASGAEEAFAGVGAGYDFNVGEDASIGIDLGADKILAGGAEILWSIGGRVSLKPSDQFQFYGLGGMGFSDGFEEPYVGGGVETQLTGKVYGKLEYRRILLTGTDVNFIGAGVGMRF